MSILEAENLHVSYGDLVALRDVSISIEEGSFTVLLGPNGAGKTTFLNTVSGVLDPRQGTVTFKGERIDQLPAHQIPRKGIAHVPEGAAMFPSMTVVDNLRVGGTNASKDEIKDRMERVFDLFPRLDERRDKHASTLSGGERQMLSIARGLMLGPDLLMLDEPSLGLAPSIVEDVFEMAKTLHQEEGLTILLVEQNARQALQLADYGYVLESGDLVLEGSADELEGRDEVRKAYLGG